MLLVKRILKIGLIAYLVYILIFSVLIYSFHTSTDISDISGELSKPMPPSGENDRVALVETAEDAISVRLDLIENSKSYIDISYYKVTDGKVAKLVLGSLLEAADRGVKVRILLDGVIQLINIGSEINNIFSGFESHPNIELKLYEPLNLLLPISWNNRLHDKIIIVDNEFALMGGRNIEDRFYLSKEYGERFVRDREVLIYNYKQKNKDNSSPSVIDDMQSYYDNMWEHKYSKPKYRYMSKRRINKGERSLENLRLEHESFKKEFLKNYFKNMKIVNWKEQTFPTEGVRFISNPIVRTSKDPRCLKAIMHLSSESRDNIIIQSPYIVPSKNISLLFKQYQINLENINLLTNSSASSPNIVAFSAYKNYKKKMVDNGLNIYEYQGPGSIHAKTAIFDGKISMVGTFNIDPRSSYLSTESMVIIDSKDFSEHLISVMQTNLNYSLKVGSNYNYVDEEGFPSYEVTRAKKIVISILSKITSLFEFLI